MSRENTRDAPAGDGKMFSAANGPDILHGRKYNELRKYAKPIAAPKGAPTDGFIGYKKPVGPYIGPAPPVSALGRAGVSQKSKAGPGGWSKTKDPDTGNWLYVNQWTQQTQWTRPAAMDAGRQAVSRPPGIAAAGTAGGASSWVPKKDATSGKIYYYNPFTLKTQWERPEDLADEGTGAVATVDKKAPPPPPRTYRQRIVALYTKHHPANLVKVDALLTKYVGKEEILLRAICKKYGVEPAAAAAEGGGLKKRQYIPGEDAAVDAAEQKACAKRQAVAGSQQAADQKTHAKVKGVDARGDTISVPYKGFQAASWRSLGKAVDPLAVYYYQKNGAWRAYSAQVSKSIEAAWAHDKERVSINGGKFIDMRDHSVIVERLGVDPTQERAVLRTTGGKKPEGVFGGH